MTDRAGLRIGVANSTNYLPFMGGAEIGLHSLLRRVTQTTEHRFSILTGTLRSELPRREVIDGVEVHRWAAPRYGLWGYVSALAGDRPTRHWIRSLRPDLLIIHYIVPYGLPSWRIARRQGLPTMLLLGGQDIYDPFITTPLPLRLLARYCIRRSPHIACYSSFVRQRLIGYFRARPEAVRTLPFGIEVDRFAEGSGQGIRDRFGIRPEHVLVFSLQRLVRRKGVDVLVRAVARIAPDYPQLRLVVGGTGPDLDALRALARELGLGEVAQFPGFIAEEEKPDFYAAADIFAMHSYYEGLGIVLEEASAAGLPVVATAAGGTTDVVESGVSGLLVEAGREEPFADALAMLVADPAMRQSMGREGKQRMRRDFSLDSVATRFLDAIERARGSHLSS